MELKKLKSDWCEEPRSIANGNTVTGLDKWPNITVKTDLYWYRRNARIDSTRHGLAATIPLVKLVRRNKSLTHLRRIDSPILNIRMGPLSFLGAKE